MSYFITCVWPRQIDCKWLDISIGSQPRVIVKKLQATSDEVAQGHFKVMVRKWHFHKRPDNSLSNEANFSPQSQFSTEQCALKG